VVEADVACPVAMIRRRLSREYDRIEGSGLLFDLARLELNDLGTLCRNAPGDLGPAGACHDDPAGFAVSDLAIDLITTTMLPLERFEIQGASPSPPATGLVPAGGPVNVYHSIKSTGISQRLFATSLDHK
jgi:hypothetical protein